MKLREPRRYHVGNAVLGSALCLPWVGVLFLFRVPWKAPSQTRLGACTSGIRRLTMEEKPLKILMTDPHMAGGGQVTYVTRLAAALTRLGHEVTIGCKPGSVLADLAQEAGCAGHSEFVLRGGIRPRAWWTDFNRVRHFIQESQPDVIHVNGSQDHWVCALTNRWMGRPVCIVRTRHNTYEVKDSFPNRRLNRSWTDYQIVVCDSVRRRLAQQRTFVARRMCTIHNGVDTEQFKPDPGMRAQARQEFGYENHHVVCGIAARLVADKGHEFLFKAANQIKEAHPEMRILVLGQGVLEESLRQLVVRLSMSDMVRFAGFRDDMPYCTQAFDIGVLPSIGCDTSSFSLKEEMPRRNRSSPRTTEDSRRSFLTESRGWSCPQAVCSRWPRPCAASCAIPMPAAGWALRGAAG